ncbi:MAG: SAVED domain-containing protein, partial [Prevotellaceae bacterium]|nr:SAVED domain-containing protein [Prevotellaceae bacterium]
EVLTKKKYNNAYIAHIVADEPNGPRGDTTRSKCLSNNINNLMLLCDEHHRLIDKVEVDSHPESRLLEMKKKHEDRIMRQTSISPNMLSDIILYGANIGKQNSPLSYQIACEAIFPDFYPANNDAIELGMKNTPFTDETDLYWSAEEENLDIQFNQKIKSQLMLGNSFHYSIFALAPQPLLIKLGVLLNDIHNIRVYQKHREPSTWKWQQLSANTTYSLLEPIDKKQIPVLVLSLSATITHDRIKKILGEKVSIWEITIDEPNNDFLQTEKILSDFRKIVRRAFDLIKSHQGCIDLHVFPAMPVSASMEFGRVWMPKADMPLVIYDENKSKGGFYKTITIN